MAQDNFFYIDAAFFLPACCLGMSHTRRPEENGEE
jgi:hypothetical protein